MKPFIYALLDPSEPAHVRYIGLSLSNPKRAHMHAAVARNKNTRRSHLVHWIRSLQAEGRNYQILVLEEFPEGTTSDDVCQAEQDFILAARSDGHKLTNATDGGEGTLGCHTLLGHKQSAEHVRKLSLIRKGRVPVAATAAAALATKGKKQSAEHIAKRFASPKPRLTLRRLLPVEVRAIRSAQGRVSLRKLASMFDVGMTTIHSVLHRKEYTDVEDLP